MTLRVILEIVPYGDEDRAYEIGRLDIFNKGTSDRNVYDYGVIDLSPGDAGLFNEAITHDRKDGAWKLVGKAIEVLDISGPHPA